MEPEDDLPYNQPQIDLMHILRGIYNSHKLRGYHVQLYQNSRGGHAQLGLALGIGSPRDIAFHAAIRCLRRRGLRMESER
jgi:hypothetical protein